LVLGSYIAKVWGDVSGRLFYKVCITDSVTTKKLLLINESILKKKNKKLPFALVLFCSKKLYGGHVILIILISPTKNESRDLGIAFWDITKLEQMVNIF